MIRNIWAVGRNYADHAKELGNIVPAVGSAPMIFLKAGSTASDSEIIRLPVWTEDVHHEVELALKINSNLDVEAVGLALDLTERKKQGEAKTQGQPWTLAKSFINSCPLSSFVKLPVSVQWSDFVLELKVQGHIRQQGSTENMIFPVPVLLQYIQKHFPVCAGDLILTGTPAGVAALKSGDLLEAQLCYQGKNMLKKAWKVHR